jgi:hypothetical protein
MASPKAKGVKANCINGKGYRKWFCPQALMSLLFGICEKKNVKSRISQVKFYLLRFACTCLYLFKKINWKNNLVLF